MVSTFLALWFAWGGPGLAIFAADAAPDGATVIRGTMASASGLWTFDRNVVDGAVNGSGWLTVVLAWFSHVLDKYIVDGLVNLVGSILQESSFIFRRLQTGLIQNYALLMLFGVFAFVSLYLVLGR